MAQPLVVCVGGDGIGKIDHLETDMEIEMRAEMGMLMGRLVLGSAFDARCSILD